MFIKGNSNNSIRLNRDSIINQLLIKIIWKYNKKDSLLNKCENKQIN